jgi:predicted RNA-binding protein associated with RNAse of E/G family
VLVADDRVSVRLVKPNHTDVVYDVEVLSDDGNHIVVRGPWAKPEAFDAGFAIFEPGDVFTEHYWRDRWYSVKEVRAADGRLKGWYTDIARPVRLKGGAIVSEDLDLDLWVSADRQTILRLDEDEFEASGLEARDPAAATQARQALDALVDLARDRWDAVLR